MSYAPVPPGLCGCCADADAQCFCIKATVAPCAAYGENYTLAVHGANPSSAGCACCAPCCAHCLLDAALPIGIQLGSGPAYLQLPALACLLRAQHRATIIHMEPCPVACCIELCCGPCSLTQVHRTLRQQMGTSGNARYTPSVGVLGLVKRLDPDYAEMGLLAPPPGANSML
jgi:Cys-rich protein (TIGR01571 family)